MKYAILGQLGLLVSRLAFGAMTFGVGRLLGSRRKETVIATKAGFRIGPRLVQAGLSRKLSYVIGLIRIHIFWLLIHRSIPPYPPK